MTVSCVGVGVCVCVCVSLLFNPDSVDECPMMFGNIDRHDRCSNLSICSSMFYTL